MIGARGQGVLASGDQTIPLKPFDVTRSPPFLFRPGDAVRFVPIERDEYDRLESVNHEPVSNSIVQSPLTKRPSISVQPLALS